MEYNNYSQQSSGSLLCPQITVWILFVLEVIGLFSLGSSSIISLLIQLAIALCVSLGINKRNYGLYRAGLITSLVISILGTVYLLIVVLFIGGAAASDSRSEIKDEDVEYLIVVLIAAGAVIWIQSCILICFRNSVESFCSMGGLYNPQAYSPQVQTPDNQYNPNNKYMV